MRQAIYSQEQVNKKLPIDIGARSIWLRMYLTVYVSSTDSPGSGSPSPSAPSCQAHASPTLRRQACVLGDSAGCSRSNVANINVGACQHHGEANMHPPLLLKYLCGESRQLGRDRLTRMAVSCGRLTQEVDSAVAVDRSSPSSLTGP